jgi:hypothetical protein
MLVVSYYEEQEENEENEKNEEKKSNVHIHQTISYWKGGKKTIQSIL